jgi:hypothetical protein
MAASKKRVIKSLDNLSEDLKELLRGQYPNGYEGSISRIVNAKKEQIFVFPLEADDAIYLVKVPMTKNSDGEYDMDSSEKGEFGEDTSKPVKGGKGAKGEDDDLENNNDDDFDGSADPERESDDYDEEGGGRKGREASYDPDFDG